jgi:hypothetical protein
VLGKEILPCQKDDGLDESGVDSVHVDLTIK